LLAIRESKLYRQEYGTFEEYCQDRWNLSRPRAYQLIDAAAIAGRLSTIVDILPATESQARPLTQLEPEEQAVAWQQAVETAPNGKVTAACIPAKMLASASCPIGQLFPQWGNLRFPQLWKMVPIGVIPPWWKSVNHGLQIPATESQAALKISPIGENVRHGSQPNGRVHRHRKKIVHALF